MHLKNYIAISTMIRAPQPPNDADIGMVRTAMLAATARSPSGYAPSIPSPHSITDTPEIPPRPMPNVHANANAEHARRYGHGHATPLCWMPQTTARSFPSPPHSPSTHLYTPERRDTSSLYIARVCVRHRQSKC